MYKRPGRGGVGVGSAPVVYGHPCLPPLEHPRGANEPDEFDQAHQPEEAHNLELGQRLAHHDRENVKGQDGDEVEEEPRAEIVPGDLPWTVFPPRSLGAIGRDLVSVEVRVRARARVRVRVPVRVS